MDFSTLAALIKPYLASLVRHGATAGAGFLVAHGVIAQGGEAQAISFLSAVALYAFAQGWSWIQKLSQAKALAGAAPVASEAPKVGSAPAALLLAFLAFGVSVAACSTAQDAAIKAAIQKNAIAIQTFCDSKVVPAAQSTVADAIAMAVPEVAQAQASAIAACKAVDVVAQSVTTMPWLADQVTIMQSKGKTLPPAVAPAPVTATGSVTTG